MRCSEQLVCKVESDQFQTWSETELLKKHIRNLISDLVWNWSLWALHFFDDKGNDLHEIGSEVVDDSTEGQPVPPRGGHVGDLHPFVTLGDLLAPFQQVLGRCQVGRTSRRRRLQI